MEPVLAHYSVKPSIQSPLVFNVSALDYSQELGSLVSDYTKIINVAQDLGLGLIASTSVDEVQHISLLATVISSVIPTIHTYDGIRGVRDFSQVSHVINSAQISKHYEDLRDDLKTLTPSASISDKVLEIIAKFNARLGTSYSPFEYTGHSSPDTVVVSFGSVESTISAKVASQLAKEDIAVGSLNIRILGPFLENEFLKSIPSSTKRLIVLGQVSDQSAVHSDRIHSSVFADIRTTLLMNGSSSLEVSEYKYASDKVWSPRDLYAILNVEIDVQPLVSDVAEFDFWDVDDSDTAHVASRLAHTLSLDDVNRVQFFSAFDNETLAGVFEAQVRVSPVAVDAPYSNDNIDVVFVNNTKVLEAFDVLKAAKHGGKVIVSGTTAENIESAVPENFKKTLTDKDISLYSLDFDIIGENPETQGRTRSMVQQIAFWKVAYPELTINQITTKIVLSNGIDTELVASTIVNLIEKVFEGALKSVELSSSSEGSTPELTETDVESDDKKGDVLKEITHEIEVSSGSDYTSNLPANVHLVSFAKGLVDKAALLDEESSGSSNNNNSTHTWVEAAKKLSFKDAYHFDSELRPDLPVKNFVGRVKVNKRVTPEEYERNIFHFELDISNTGLTYAIGEALGVHAPNDSEQVLEFLKWYGVDPESIVSVASVDDGVIETRTAYHAARENLDLFGKPPKKFFESLAAYAENDKQKAELERLASAEGAEDLKKRSEVDFDTFVDILQEFDSAHPSFKDLVTIVAPLKRREYSIASSQKVHPNEVHLLVVVVDWIDSRGRTRYGQCSRYLSQLKEGQELVVSVKPSVMKLPPLSTQPIIMSGLGTGLAPFKAFIEEKTWQQAQGLEIGDIYLYLGSRHKREEYLYGELWEAYKDSGIITHIGAAFSRDQPHKIYIQDRILESLDDLVEAFVSKNGHFYLCGPTWPVPDITNCLGQILQKDANARGDKVDVDKEIEALKESGRYVLEVY